MKETGQSLIKKTLLLTFFLFFVGFFLVDWYNLLLASNINSDKSYKTFHEKF